MLIVDDNSKRSQWRMADVVETFPGKDNFVRVADIRLSDGNILKRPVTKLVILMKEFERMD